MLESDLARAFPSDEAVNKALHKTDVATKNDLADLTVRLARLEEKLGGKSD